MKSNLLLMGFVLSACSQGGLGSTHSGGGGGPVGGVGPDGTFSSTSDLTSGSGDTDPAGTSGGTADGSDSSDSGGDGTQVILERSWISAADGGQEASGLFDLPEGPFASVRLVVDLESPCYPLESWPALTSGHRWPEQCDPIPRLMNVTVDGETAQDGVELLRAITPFGGPAHFEQDITGWANANPGAHTLIGYISTSADPSGQAAGVAAGWYMSAQIISMEETPNPETISAEQLFLGNIEANSANPLVLSFEVPEGVSSGTVRYFATGHGRVDDPGCPLGAEEFCQREHTISLDGMSVGLVAPYRSSCESLCSLQSVTWPSTGEQTQHCAQNPMAYGTEATGVATPRANWCPGDIINPIDVPLPSLMPGSHEVSVSITGIAGSPARWWTSVHVLTHP